MGGPRKLLLLLVLVFVICGIAADSSCSKALEGKIKDSAELSAIVANARSQYESILLSDMQCILSLYRGNSVVCIVSDL